MNPVRALNSVSLVPLLTLIIVEKNRVINKQTLRKAITG